MSPTADYNLGFFVKKELSYKSDIDYIIVINGRTHSESINFPELENLIIIKRDNIGFDFGGHKAALDYLSLHNKTYDYYFFMNSGVIGPILPSYFPETQPHWTNCFINKITDSVKLVGTTIVCLPWYVGKTGPKVEGFFFMTDQKGLNLLLDKKTIFSEHPDKHSAIYNGEYALSECILSHGYTIDCMLPKYQNIDWHNTSNHNHNNNCYPSRKNAYFGKSIDPYEVIFHKWDWHDNHLVNFEIVKEYVASQNRIQ